MTKMGCLLLTCLWIVQASFAFEKELKGLSAVLADDISKSGKKSVGVVDFSDLQGAVTDGGRFLAEEFTVDLAASGKGFNVIERNRLQAILGEHKLATPGVIDAPTAKKLGELAGIDAIVTGVVTPLGETARVFVKVLAADTAEVIGAVSGDIPIEKPVQALFAQNVSADASGMRTVTAPTPAVTATKSSPAQVAATESPREDWPPPQRVNDYSFEVKRCGADAEHLVCEVLATNTRPDKRELYITKQRTRAFDDAGHEYASAPEIIGDHVASFHLAGFFVSNAMPAGVGVNMKFRFSKFLAKAGKIAVLKVTFTDENGKDFAVQLSNIPVAKE